MGTLTTADVTAFATLCELEASRQQASAQKNGDGWERAIRLEIQAATALRPYYEKFGLEPSGRARLTPPKTDAPAAERKWAGI